MALEEHLSIGADKEQASQNQSSGMSVANTIIHKAKYRYEPAFIPSDLKGGADLPCNDKTTRGIQHD